MDGQDYCTIIGRYDDSGEATVIVVPVTPGDGDPHMLALRQIGAYAAEETFEVVAVLKGKCDVLVTQQSLRIFAERYLAG